MVTIMTTAGRQMVLVSIGTTRGMSWSQLMGRDDMTSDIPGFNVTPFYIAGLWICLIMLFAPIIEAEWREWKLERKQANTKREGE